MSYFVLTLQAAKLNSVATAELDPREGTEDCRSQGEFRDTRVEGGECLYFRGHWFGAAGGSIHSSMHLSQTRKRRSWLLAEPLLPDPRVTPSRSPMPKRLVPAPSGTGEPPADCHHQEWTPPLRLQLAHDFPCLHPPHQWITWQEKT